MVILMAENDKEKDMKKEEERLSKTVKKLDDLVRADLDARPYLLVVATGFPLETKGEVSTLAPQWSWRSNVIVGREESERVMDFLADQLKDAVEDKECGIRKKYRQ
jgi:hypothetical protein